MPRHLNGIQLPLLDLPSAQSTTSHDPLMDLPVAKRPKVSHSATQPNASAVARFFATPELVQILLDYLHTDRIDLLVLAAVCKGLRTPALQVWVRHLDFNRDDFEGKLKLLKANTHLLPHIRCLRIFNRAEPGGERSTRFWNQAKTLFSLLAAYRPFHDPGPLLDIAIDVDDGDGLYQALQPFPRFAQRICALRLEDECRFTPLEADDAAKTFSTTGWISLALLLKDALQRRPSSVESLRVLEYKTNSDDQEVQVRRAAKQIFWSTLATQCHSLHELCLSVYYGSQADHLIRHGLFTSLKAFELEDMSREEDDKLDVEAVKTFLNRHTGLERLLLFSSTAAHRGSPLLDQTFPALQDLELGIHDIPSPAETVFQFVRRHSRLRRLVTPHLNEYDGRAALLKSLLSACPETYKHLPSIENLSEGELSALIKDGARPLRAKVNTQNSTMNRTGVISDTEPSPELGMLWSGVRPECVEDLTFLTLVLRVPNFVRQEQRLFQLFACGILPNLTELHLQLVGREDDFPTLNELVHQLIPSTSIRVLCIMAPPAPDLAPKGLPLMLMTRHLFPVRFELLCWGHGSQEYNYWTKNSMSGKYFRFVADSSETQHSASPRAAQLGKLGRLQAIPERMVLTQVGANGVWRQKSENGMGLNSVEFVDYM
ncbi:unnamed protein product [Tilletia controversa]|nr:unnamed protein product [Tilletia controversa]CAD6977865.1 unnamed protein product [Tilletia controversa]